MGHVSNIVISESRVAAFHWLSLITHLILIRLKEHALVRTNHTFLLLCSTTIVLLTLRTDFGVHSHLLGLSSCLATGAPIVLGICLLIIDILFVVLNNLACT